MPEKYCIYKKIKYIETQNISYIGHNLILLILNSTTEHIIYLNKRLETFKQIVKTIVLHNIDNLVL